MIDTVRLLPIVFFSIVFCSITVFTNGSAVSAQSDNLDRHGDLLSKPAGKGVPIATVTKDALKAKIDRGERIFLVAVTDHRHFSRSHMPGSVELRLRDDRRKARHKLPDKNGQVIVYALDSATEETDELARDLVAQGYTNVRIYPGGLREWLASGYGAVGSHPNDP